MSNRCDECDGRIERILDLELDLEQAVAEVKELEILEPPGLRVELVRAGVVSDADAYRGDMTWTELLTFAVESMLEEP